LAMPIMFGSRIDCARRKEVTTSTLDLAGSFYINGRLVYVPTIARNNLVNEYVWHSRVEARSVFRHNIRPFNARGFDLSSTYWQLEMMTGDDQSQQEQEPTLRLKRKIPSFGVFKPSEKQTEQEPWWLADIERHLRDGLSQPMRKTSAINKRDKKNQQMVLLLDEEKGSTVLHRMHRVKIESIDVSCSWFAVLASLSPRQQWLENREPHRAYLCSALQRREDIDAVRNKLYLSP